MFSSPIVRRSLVALAVAGAIAGSVGTAEAVVSHHSGAAPAGSNTEHFALAGLNLPSAKLHDTTLFVAHGPITGGGTDVQRRQEDILHLKGGTLVIHHPNKQSHFSAKINPKTCYATFTLTGKYTLTGTGAYKDEVGSGSYKGDGQGILPRTKSGSCSRHAEPAPEITTITASGPVTLK